MNVLKITRIAPLVSASLIQGAYSEVQSANVRIGPTHSRTEYYLKMRKKFGSAQLGRDHSQYSKECRSVGSELTEPNSNFVAGNGRTFGRYYFGVDPQDGMDIDAHPVTMGVVHDSEPPCVVKFSWLLKKNLRGVKGHPDGTKFKERERDRQRNTRTPHGLQIPITKSVVPTFGLHFFRLAPFRNAR